MKIDENVIFVIMILIGFICGFLCALVVTKSSRKFVHAGKMVIDLRGKTKDIARFVLEKDLNSLSKEQVALIDICNVEDGKALEIFNDYD